jgi:hypothetical protein
MTSKRTWILTDVDQDIYHEGIVISPANVTGKAGGYTITKRTLRGGLREGVDVIEVDNGCLRFVVLPTRGMGVWNAMLGNLWLAWKSPVKGPVHPALVDLNEASGIGWLDGFDEMLVRCGLESNGAPEFNPNGTLRHPLHGKIANIPAHKVEVTVDGETGDIAVTGVVDESRLFGNKLRMTSTITTQAGSPSFTVTDVITNPSDEPAELELLYHINFGVPLLNPGSKVVLPVRKVAPRDGMAASGIETWDTYGPESPGTPESCYFFELCGDSAGRTQALLHNAEGNQGVSLKFNQRELPCFTLWKNPQSKLDGYVTGLEPGINFPNRKSFEKEQGRVAVLAPDQSRAFQVTVEAHPDARSVQAARDAVARLQYGVSPQVLTQPDPKWSAR